MIPAVGVPVTRGQQVQSPDEFVEFWLEFPHEHEPSLHVVQLAESIDVVEEFNDSRTRIKLVDAGLISWG
jgi:hypothetical protein